MVSALKRLPIKWKIQLIVLLTCWTALLGAGVALLSYERVTARERLASEINTLAEITGRNCLAALRFDDAANATKDTLANLSRDPRITAAAIYKDSALWAQYENGAEKVRPAAPAQEPGELPNAVITAGKDSRLEIAREIRDLGEREGVIWMSASLQSVNERLLKYSAVLFSVMLLAAALTWWLGSKLAKLVNEPLGELTAMARAVSEKRDYSLRAVKRSEDEVGVLTETFNQMLGQIQLQNSELMASAERLRVSHQQLADINETLEQTVESRTSELREAMKEAQSARDAAEAANRAKSTFLAAMSHELRTPLTAIIGFSEMLLADAEAENRAEAVDDLNRINGSARHLLGVINDILDISKVEAGKMELHLEDFEVSALVKDVIGALEPLLQNRKNKLVVERKETVATMRADLLKVRQCLFNLLSNANKFTDKGQITLTVRSFTERGETWIAFDVQDTGIGISTEQMQRLFKVFSQAEDSTSRKYGGTGLGLALTKQFCEMMRGSVKVQSEPGKGSTFTIVLPVRVKPVGTTAAVAPERPSAQDGALRPCEANPILSTLAHPRA